MFDPGFTEFVLLFVIALLILGPERLPRVASQIGRWVGRARRTVNQLRHQLEREVALEQMNRSQHKKKTQRDHGAKSDAPGGASSGSPPGADARSSRDEATLHGAGASAPAGPAREDTPGAAEDGEEPPAPSGGVETERTDTSSSA